MNKIWQISDSEIINKIEENFNDKEILIADGHHRYETSLNYMNEVKTEESEYAMFYLSGTNQDGLLINPTHRILQNVNGIKDIVKSISDSFIISEYSDEIIEDELRPNEFFIISILIYKYGSPVNELINKYFNLLSVIFTVLLIAGFFLFKIII